MVVGNASACICHRKGCRTELRAQQQCAVTSSTKHVYHKWLESNRHNILGPTNMLWLGIHSKGCAQKVPLLFWAGLVWRKWNVIVIRSLGWLRLFNSLGLPHCARGSRWGGTAHKFHTTAWGLAREEGMTGAEVCEVLHQIIPAERSPRLQGRALGGCTLSQSEIPVIHCSWEKSDKAITGKSRKPPPSSNQIFNI